jgi:predicted PurR-regulated permease PerM
VTSLTEGLGAFNGLRAPVFGAALALLGVLIMWGFLPSLGWAIVFAIITWPLYTRFLRRLPEHRRGGVLAPLCFTLIIGVMLVVPLCIAAIAVGREALVLMHWAAEAVRTGPSVPDRLPRLPTIGGYLAEWWRANLTDPVAASRIMGHINSGMLVAWTGALGPSSCGDLSCSC